MAFNPFRGFRKHQKVVFAVLTIVCMLTFVMAGVSGRIGDVFDEITRLISGRHSRTEIARLYGKSLDGNALLILREQRQQANSYMLTAIDQTTQRLLNDLQKSVPNVQSIMFTFYQLVQRGSGIEFLLSSLEGERKRLHDANKPDDAEKLSKLEIILERQYQRYQSSDEPSQLYFGGSTSLEGLLDFLVWSHEADRLGIQFTADDVRKQIKGQTLDLLTPELDQQIRDTLAKRSRLSVSLLNALAEEFRVRLAQAALTGYDPNGMTRVPATATPYELWEYYLKERTEVSVQMLPVPVSRFEAQVKEKEKPTKEELEGFYRKYRKVEYSPKRDTPGFMLPRRVKVQWAEVSPDAPYYRTQSRNLLLSQEGMAFGNNPLGVLALNTVLAEEYKSLRYSYVWNDLHTPALNRPDFALSFYTYEHLNRPQTVAALLGQAAPGNAGLVNALVGLPGAAVAREAREMAPAVAKEANRRFVPLATALGGCGAGPAGALASLSAWAAAGSTEERLPFEVVEKDLLRQVEKKLADLMARTSIDTLKEKLDAARKEAEKNKTSPETAAGKVADEQIRQHHWTHGASTELHGSFDIGQDPGLKGLWDAYLSIHSLDDRFGKRFGDLFFAEPASSSQSRLYTLQKLGRGEDFFAPRGEETFVYWTTADQAPEVVPFDKAEPKVREAWYREKARPLAAAEAERIAKEARAAGGDPLRNLLDAAKGQPLITIDGIARQTRGPSARPEFNEKYSAYVVPEDKIQYPPPDFVDKIVDLPSKGDVTIVSNQPKTIYYVVAVTQRIEPTQKEFQDAQLLPDLERLRRREYRQNVLLQLQLQAHLYIDAENAKQLEERGRGGALGED